MIHEISISTKRKTEFIDITSEVNDIVKKENVQEGVCVIFCPHTTAGLVINENADLSVRKDIISSLQRLIPEDEVYSHLEGNSPAHIKSSILGNSLTVFIENKRLKLGTWQGIFFCEFDGPRNRKIWVKILK
ncbi:YjbQ family protein [Candidatus Woesearchaeota archaeon]|nr:MAG: YjbQ family protein [Candidatus Woesearchaeota archaeon]